jgi:hypothetical protein
MECDMTGPVKGWFHIRLGEVLCGSRRSLPVSDLLVALAVSAVKRSAPPTVWPTWPLGS